MSKEIKYKLFKPLAVDKRLTYNEKLVAMFIYTLHYSNLKCNAKNSYIAYKLNLSIDIVENAISRLEKHCLVVDSRNTYNINYIQVCNTEICKKRYYMFDSKILHSKLNPSAKFILVYIQSFNRKDFKFFLQKYDLKENIGLTTKHQIKSALKQLLDLKLLREINNEFEGTHYMLYKNIKKIK